MSSRAHVATAARVVVLTIAPFLFWFWATRNPIFGVFGNFDFHMKVVAGALLAAGILGALLADRVRIPGLLLFLGFGMLAGSAGIGGIAFTDTDLYALSRERFDVLASGHKKLAINLFDTLARMLAIRLRYTNAELRLLQLS